MSDPIKTLVAYRLERARETLEEAKLLLVSGTFDVRQTDWGVQS